MVRGSWCTSWIRLVFACVVLLGTVSSSCDDPEADSGWDCHHEVVECRVGDCSCTHDLDCTLQRCAIPMYPGHECDSCTSCTNGYPVPVTAWIDLERAWLDKCGPGLCKARSCPDDVDCCGTCIYEPRCEEGRCVGVLATWEEGGLC